MQNVTEENSTQHPQVRVDYALAPPTDADLVNQGAEAAARAKMFMQDINKSLADHYSVLEQRLTALAMKMERC